MTVIVTVLLPLFGLMLAGWFAARRQLIDRDGIAGLNGFVFYFALPLMLFHNVADAPLAEQLDGGYMLAYLLPGLAINLAGMAIARWFWGRGLGGQAIHGIAAAFGNSVFIALPLALELFGPRAALPMTLLIAIESGLLMPLAIALLELDRPAPGVRRQAARAAARAILRNPLVMSVLAGAGLALAGISLPPLLDGLVLLVRDANVPCALFALGASMAGLPLVVARLREVGLLLVLKLLAYPALVLIAMRWLPDVEPAWRAIAVLAAAVPVGANVYLVAARYGVALASASTAVVLSTLVSLITLSALIIALDQQLLTP